MTKRNGFDFFNKNQQHRLAVTLRGRCAGITIMPPRGYIYLHRRTTEETKWHFSTERAFGLWSLSAHGFGLRLDIIGPFSFRMRSVTA